MAKRAPEPWYHPPQEEICALCGRAVPPTIEMNVGAPLIIAKPLSIQLVRTVISRP